MHEGAGAWWGGAGCGARSLGPREAAAGRPAHRQPEPNPCSPNSPHPPSTPPTPQELNHIANLRMSNRQAGTSAFSSVAMSKPPMQDLMTCVGPAIAAVYATFATAKNEAAAHAAAAAAAK